jgi:hypothetical protein
MTRKKKQKKKLIPVVPTMPAKLDPEMTQLVELSNLIRLTIARTLGNSLDEHKEQAVIFHEQKMPNKIDGTRFVAEDLRQAARDWITRARDFERIGRALNAWADGMENAIRMSMVNKGVSELVGNDWTWTLNDDVLRCEPNLKGETNGREKYRVAGGDGTGGTTIGNDTTASN